MDFDEQASEMRLKSLASRVSTAEQVQQSTGFELLVPQKCAADDIAYCATNCACCEPKSIAVGGCRL